MLESSLSKNNETLIKNQASNIPEIFSHKEISANNKQEFQNIVKEMILNLVMKTEADIIRILRIAQEYKEATSKKTN
jgi:hypothetical protein